MDHVAILNPKMAKVEDIISGDKTIESRWCKHRTSPFGKIKEGETVYFKKTGGMVSAKAVVKKVIQLDHPSENLMKEYIDKYIGKGFINLNMSKEGLLNYAKDRPYIVLIFLEKPELIIPFRLNKNGFGSASAWLCVPNISAVKL